MTILWVLPGGMVLAIREANQIIKAMDILMSYRKHNEGLIKRVLFSIGIAVATMLLLLSSAFIF